MGVSEQKLNEILKQIIAEYRQNLEAKVKDTS